VLDWDQSAPGACDVLAGAALSACCPNGAVVSVVAALVVKPVRVVKHGAWRVWAWACGINRCLSALNAMLADVANDAEELPRVGRSGSGHCRIHTVSCPPQVLGQLWHRHRPALFQRGGYGVAGGWWLWHQDFLSAERVFESIRLSR
jgi:hypothetical protein